MVQNEESGVEGQCIEGDEEQVEESSSTAAATGGEEKSPPEQPPKVVKAASKKEMLGFAVPALGIYLTNPLLSNMDNAFVGRTVGTAGLAALSPATICTDQMLYLFSFLSRATTSLVARAYALRSNNNHPSGGGNDEAAREAASAPLTVSLLCGAGLSLFYAIGTPFLLRALRVDAALRPAAASYIYWRGAIAWAALAQAACLSTHDGHAGCGHAAENHWPGGRGECGGRLPAVRLAAATGMRGGRRGHLVGDALELRLHVEGIAKETYSSPDQSAVQEKFQGTHGFHGTFAFDHHHPTWGIHCHATHGHETRNASKS